MADNKLIKSAGEHWVCSVLSRLGWAAALTRDGVERTDILAANLDGKHISVQVKTTQEWKNPKFMFGQKGCEPSRSPQEWFVLVALGRGEWEAPRAFVVPRDHAAAGAWIRHMEWLTNPLVKPGKRNSSLGQNRIDVMNRGGIYWQAKLIKSLYFCHPVAGRSPLKSESDCQKTIRGGHGHPSGIPRNLSQVGPHFGRRRTEMLGRLSF